MVSRNFLSTHINNIVVALVYKLTLTHSSFKVSFLNSVEFDPSSHSTDPILDHRGMEAREVVSLQGSSCTWLATY